MQANIIILLLTLILVALGVVAFQLLSLRVDYASYESNLRAFLETLK